MFRAAILTTVAALAVACSTPTKVTSHTKDPTNVSKMNSVVVIADGVTPQTRHSVEDKFVGELAQRGVNATPSYKAIGESIPPGNAAAVELQKKGYDGLMVVDVGPGRVHQYTVASSPNWPGMWGPGYGTQPDEVQTETVVKSQAAMWDLRQGKQVWGATTETRNPSNGQDIAKSISKKLMPVMEKDGVVSEKSD